MTNQSKDRAMDGMSDSTKTLMNQYADIEDFVNDHVVGSDNVTKLLSLVRHYAKDYRKQHELDARIAELSRPQFSNTPEYREKRIAYLHALTNPKSASRSESA